MYPFGCWSRFEYSRAKDNQSKTSQISVWRVGSYQRLNLRGPSPLLLDAAGETDVDYTSRYKTIQYK